LTNCLTNSVKYYYLQGRNGD